MKSLLKAIGVLIVVITAIGAAVFFTGNTMNVLVAVLGPPNDFDLSRKGPAPDYADAANWAALPETDDLADLTPEGVEPGKSQRDFDVFFIHPTGYMRGADWNWVIDPDTSTDQNTSWMLSNQASAFNTCCNVYAPRYRQASIFAYLTGDKVMMNQALEFAYEDVERAFDDFVTNRSKGRPFIIAGHSQGTYHADVLLKKRISGTPLRDQMVAAYIIGGRTTHQTLDEMPDIAACDSLTDLHCVIHWRTFGEGGSANEEWVGGDRVVCTNPISWRDDGERAAPEGHVGAVPATGNFAIKLYGPDVPQDIPFGPLGKPVPGHTWAECRDGFLFVADQSETQFSALGNLPGKNYHGLDYPLFHMDIRENTMTRVAAYLAELAEHPSRSPNE